MPPYVPFGPSPRRSRTEAQAVRDAEQILEQTGLIPYRDSLADEHPFVVAITTGPERLGMQ